MKRFLVLKKFQVLLAVVVLIILAVIALTATVYAYRPSGDHISPLCFIPGRPSYGGPCIE